LKLKRVKVEDLENAIQDIHNAGGTLETEKPATPKIEKLRYRDAKGKMKIWRGPAEQLPGIVDQIVETGGTIDTTKSTLSDERLRLYQEAKARGDDEAAELALYGKRQGKRTRSDVLLDQIDKKVAAGTLQEGSAEHLSLLGASGDKIQTPEDRLKYWQTVLQKTTDPLGMTLEGQEDTAELAAGKIEEAKDEVREKLAPQIKAIGLIAPKLDPASREQLKQIIREGDPAKINEVYRRIRKQSAVIR